MGVLATLNRGVLAAQRLRFYAALSPPGVLTLVVPLFDLNLAFRVALPLLRAAKAADHVRVRSEGALCSPSSAVAVPVEPAS